MPTDIAEPHYRTRAGLIRCGLHTDGTESERLTARDKWTLMRDTGSAVLCETCRQDAD